MAAAVNYEKNKKAQMVIYGILTVLFIGIGVWTKKIWRAPIMYRYLAIVAASYLLTFFVLRKVIPCKPMGEAKAADEKDAIAPSDQDAVAVPADTQTGSETAA